MPLEENENWARLLTEKAVSGGKGDAEEILGRESILETFIGNFLLR